MRMILVLLLWLFNTGLFVLAIYLKYFTGKNHDVFFLVLGAGILMFFVTIPGSEFVLNQIHKENTFEE